MNLMLTSRTDLPYSRWRLALVLLALTILAGALRLAALDSLPPGLYRDEAYNGLDALGVLEGERPLYFEANNGREPLFIYLLAGAVAWLGRSPGALRMVSALLGTLTVPALYWLGRELFSPRVALVGAALAVTSVWLLSLSRVALRAGMLPLIAALALAALWRGQRLQRVGWMILGGLLVGMTFYTYLAARFIPMALALWGGWCAYERRKAFWWQGWAVAAVVMGLLALPLGVYLVRHGELLGRAGQVSIWNPAIHQGDFWGTLVRNLWRTVRALIYGGDFIPRHNVPWRPVFTWWMAIAAYGGIGLAAYRARRGMAERMALVWLGVMALPTILAEGAPHFLRGVGILPVLFFFPALTLEALWGWKEGRWRAAALTLMLVAVVSAAWLDTRAFFQHLQSENVYYQFESGATEMALAINRHLGSGWQGQGMAVPRRVPRPEKGVWIEQRLWEQWPAVRFLVADMERVVPLEQGALPPFAPEDLLVILWPYADHSSILEGLPRQRVWEIAEGAWERGDLETEPRLLYVTLHGTEVSGLPKLKARWADGIVLLDAQAVPLEDGTGGEVRLWWLSEGNLATDYSVFRHVLCDGQIVAQKDTTLGEGYWPATVWRSGDMFLDRQVIRWEGASGHCQVLVGLYRREDLQRLPLREVQGFFWAEDALVIQFRP